MELLRLPHAARALQVSTPTLKQWIYRGRIRSIKTAGGHHRIPRAEVDRLLFGKQRGPGQRPTQTLSAVAMEMATGLEHFISGRNQLVGRIVKLQTMGLLTKAVLDIGGQTITAIITRDASRDLGLKVGATAAALIKATEVMIIRPTGNVRTR